MRKIPALLAGLSGRRLLEFDLVKELNLALTLPALVLTGCASLKSVDPTASQQVDRTESQAIADPGGTTLGKRLQRLVRHQPAGQSGFLLLDKGEEALLWRGMLADQASHTIDTQYFIWYQDNVGKIAAERLLRAAERGVRVRVIVDEISLDADPRFLAWLNDHPQVEIRLYNPAGILGLDTLGKLARLIGAGGDFPRLNRRMHNKTFIIDGSVAILGGRNVADEYYDLNRQFNFRDLDVLTVGPVVPAISRSFDEYWNDPWVVPLEAVVDLPITPAERAAYYQGLHQYAAQPENFPPRFNAGLAATADRFRGLKATDLHWGPARLIYDRPGKNPELDRYDAFGESGRQLTDLARGARREVLAATPYLIMLPGTFDLLEGLRDRDVRVAILTNSMAANDAVWVHSRYAFQRRRLRLPGRVRHPRPRSAGRPDRRCPGRIPAGPHAGHGRFRGSRFRLPAPTSDPATPSPPRKSPGAARPLARATGPARARTSPGPSARRGCPPPGRWRRPRPGCPESPRSGYAAARRVPPRPLPAAATGDGP